MKNQFKHLKHFSWNQNKTGGLISSVVSPSDFEKSTWLLLVNANYFKAFWQTPFPNVSGTQKFYLGHADEIVQVPMMSKKMSVRTAEIPELDAKALELPYQGGQVIRWVQHMTREQKFPWLCVRFMPGLFLFSLFK